MYARLGTEKRKNATLTLDAVRSKVAEVGEDGEPAIKPGLSASDAEEIWDRKDKEKQFRESETKVLMRHPDALNEDGTFNMNSEFTKVYMDIGNRNPMLTMMVNGPELAEAMVEKDHNLQYTKGRKDEAARVAAGKGAHTATSTTAVNAAVVAQLPAVKARIAKRMGMTDKEYIEYENKIKAGNKRV